MDKETITVFIVFCISTGLVMTGYYLGKWLNEDDRPLSTSCLVNGSCVIIQQTTKENGNENHTRTHRYATYNSVL
jgi:surface polysaccharide O-acyltransferase-like enzyme